MAWHATVDGSEIRTPNPPGMVLKNLVNNGTKATYPQLVNLAGFLVAINVVESYVFFGEVERSNSEVESLVKAWAKNLQKVGWLVGITNGIRRKYDEQLLQGGAPYDRDKCFFLVSLVPLYKWSYKCVAGVITLLIGVSSPHLLLLYKAHLVLPGYYFAKRGPLLTFMISPVFRHYPSIFSYWRDQIRWHNFGGFAPRIMKEVWVGVL